jgi:hypothetical protein
MLRQAVLLCALVSCASTSCASAPTLRRPASKQALKSTRGWWQIGGPSVPVKADVAPSLNPNEGLCPIDVKGITIDVHATTERVLVLARAPNDAANEELRERARVMSYRTRYMEPSDYTRHDLPIAVDVTVEHVHGGVILSFRPREFWKLAELARLLDDERRLIGRDLCARR